MFKQNERRSMQVKGEVKAVTEEMTEVKKALNK